MREIRILGTNLTVSRFTFGTASLHHLGSEAMQAAHLTAAAREGFTHFDTAPLYGFGGAERAFGEAFGGEPRITVATKVGLYPPGGANQGRAMTLARKAAGKLWPAQSRAVADMSVARARTSLECSLKRLRRHHVDLLLIHEPDAMLLKTEEWLRWFDDEADRVRNVGIAGPPTVVRPFLEADMPLATVIQTRDSLVGREADMVTSTGRSLQLTYGYFTSGTDGRSGEEILAGALARNPTGSIVVSTRSRARLKEFVQAASMGTEQC